MSPDAPACRRPLVLLVRDASGEARREAFLRSPIRIGRDPAADLVLDAGWISGQHGLVQFDDDEAFYTDLGSRNGSALGGRPCAPHTPVRWLPAVGLELGPLRLTFERAVLPRDAGPSDAPSSGAIRPGAITALLRELARTPEEAPADAWAASVRPGVKVGRFELLRELGRGGFGVVFEARDQQLGRRVALKAVRLGGALDTAGDGWLLREAEAAAQLAHPNIVRLYDAGTWEGGPYLIYELLRGEGLDARLARGPLPAREALQVAVEVAHALAHAHAAGVIHRDVKPSNVLLAADGGVKVLDFGLAHVIGGRDRRGGGTPRYMAPEQGDRPGADPRLDVYSAAVVLRETWLGPGASDDQLRTPSPLEGAPPPLQDLLAAALDPDPAGRPADGGAWLAALRAVQGHAGPPSRRGA